MLGRYKFKAGQRVRLSTGGIKANIAPPHWHDASGVVVSVDRFNCPTVLWDYRKSTSSYHPDFIRPDRRCKRPPKGGEEMNP